MDTERKNKRKEVAWVLALWVLEILVLVALLSQFPLYVTAGTNADNVTSISILAVGNSFPTVNNVTVNSIDLTANATTSIEVYAILQDFDEDSDISHVSSEFFDNSLSFYGDADDNNYHYTNTSCVFDTSYGDITEANATCTYELEYYANNQTWNATFRVNDSLNTQGFGSGLGTVNALLALALPDSIDYGLVNATEISLEQEANITNVGNTRLNLSLTGYGSVPLDGWALNCSLGQNISIDNEKYNLTASNPGVIATLADLNENHTSLSTAVAVRDFDLAHRQNDAAPLQDDTNSTYWRLYVPLGAAGTCSGNLVVGAITAGES